MQRALLWIAVSSRLQAADDRVSLPEQERLLREYATNHGYSIVGLLKVPGHSRSASDIVDLLAEYEAAGITAYADLRALWKAKAFDSLLAFDSSRIGRSLSLVTWIFESVINSGACIELIQGGRFDESNADIGIAMCAISATAGLRRLKKLGDAGMQARMNRGLSMNSVPSTHRLIHDEVSGKPLRLEVREELRPLFDDMAKLLLEGIGWTQFPNLMAALGHLNPNTGKPYPSSFFHKLFHNPYTWGVAARRFVNKYGLWAFDEGMPLPRGVLVNRNPSPSIPPVWTGRDAQLIQAELRRRTLISGRATARRTYKFTGLLICAGCGRTLTITLGNRDTQKVKIYWQCPIYKLGWRAVRTCDQRKTARDDVVQQQIADTFARLAGLKTFDLAELSQSNAQEDALAEITRLRKQIAALSKRVDVMITRQAEADERVQQNYAKQIEATSEQLVALDERLQALLVQVESSPTAVKDRQIATQEIIEHMEEFWSRPSREINQTLHRALGKLRFVVSEGKIVDVR